VEDVASMAWGVRNLISTRDLAAPVRVHQERFAEKVVQDAIVSENDVINVV
jgi:hypothetical protein